MKNSRLAVWCSAGSLSLFLAAAAHGQQFGQPFGQQTGPQTRWYFKADAGGVVTEDVKIKEFLGATDIGKYEFDTGVRFDMGVGYHFTPWFSAEAETGVLYNSIRHQGDSSLSSVPMMVNAVFNIPTGTRLVPFVGVGGGGVVSVLNADFLTPPDHNNVFIDGTDSDVVLAWQAFAGLRYNINDHFDISLAYRYLGTEEPSWDVHEEFRPFGPPVPSGGIKFGHLDSHAVVLGVNLHF